MAIFVSRDRYFSFTENPKKNNIVNKLTIPVAQVTTDSEETILATTINNKHVTEYDYYEVLTMPYATNIQEIIPLSVSYQSNAEEISKYSTILYRVKALKVNTYKKSYIPYSFNVKPEGIIESEFWYGNNQNNKIENINDAIDSDYETLFTGVCKINSNYLCSFGPEISQYKFINTREYKSDVYSDIPFLDVWTAGLVVAEERTFVADFYTNFYVELVGVKRSIDYGNSIYLAQPNQRILFNEELGDNSFIQNETKYNQTPITDYISDIVFKNYSKGRPVATLEWVGSPEVNHGTELIIEPRREYVEEELITYVVVGKKITYNGGYRETLYLVKKEYGYATIFTKLKDVTILNSTYSVKYGDSYSAILSTDEDCSITSISVIMNGVDITSSSYSEDTKEINISSVDGDIIITAKAYKDVHITIFGSGGLPSMSGYYIKYGGEFVFPDNNESIDGSPFLGYSTDINGGSTIYSEGDKIIVYEDMVFYKVWDIVEPPIIKKVTTPLPTDYVAMTNPNEEDGGIIYYTKDGTTPTTSSSVYSGTIYVAPFVFTTFKAFVYYNENKYSTITTATFGISSGGGGNIS